MFGEDETDTQQLDQQDEYEGGAQGNTDLDDENEGGEGAGEGNEYFLTVDDRTRYRTQQEAIAGFQNAGRRIAELSPWDKEVSQKFGGLTPQQTAQILLDYIELKKGQKTNANPASAAANTHDGQSPTQSDANMTPEQKEAVDFLKKMGFITKAEADAMKKEIDTLKGNVTQTQERTDTEKFNSLVEIGRSVMREELIGGKFIPSKFATAQEKEKAEKFSKRIEVLASSYIDEDQERIQRFQAGGEETRAICREAIKDAITSLGLTPRGNALTTAQNKNNVLNRNPRPLPQSGSPSARKAPRKSDEGLTPDVHRRAAEVFDSIVGGTND